MDLPISFRPKLVDALKDYSAPKFHADLAAGLTVGIIAFAAGHGAGDCVRPETRNRNFHRDHRRIFGFVARRFARANRRAGGRVCSAARADCDSARAGSAGGLRDDGGRDFDCAEVRPKWDRSSNIFLIPS